MSDYGIFLENSRRIFVATLPRKPNVFCCIELTKHSNRNFSHHFHRFAYVCECVCATIASDAMSVCVGRLTKEIILWQKETLSYDTQTTKHSAAACAKVCCVRCYFKCALQFAFKVITNGCTFLPQTPKQNPMFCHAETEILRTKHIREAKLKERKSLDHHYLWRRNRACKCQTMDERGETGEVKKNTTTADKFVRDGATDMLKIVKVLLYSHTLSFPPSRRARFFRSLYSSESVSLNVRSRKCKSPSSNGYASECVCSLLSSAGIRRFFPSFSKHFHRDRREKLSNEPEKSRVCM